MPFPVRIIPYEDESLIGFVARMGARNHIMRTHTIFSAMGSRSKTTASVAFSPFNLDALSDLSEVKPDKLRDMSYWPAYESKIVTFQGYALPKIFVSPEQRRACPHCLRMSLYHRSIWDLTAIDVCHVHKCKLLNCCPNCKKKLSWTFADLNQCRCGFKFTNAKTVPVDEHIADGVAEVTRMFSRRGQKTCLLTSCDLSPSSKILLAYVLGRQSMGLERGNRRASQFAHDPRLSEALAAGVKACQDWPNSFFSVLDELRSKADRRGGRYGFQKMFGQFGGWMLSPDTPSDIRETLRIALVAYFEKNPMLRARTKGVARIQSPMMTLTNARKRLGVSDYLVADTLVKYGHIDPKDRLGIGSPVLVAVDVVEQIRREMDGLANKTQVSQLLGCSKELTRKITSSWTVPRATGIAAEINWRRSWRISDVEDFVASFEKILDTKRVKPLRSLTSMLNTLLNRNADDVLKQLSGLRGIPGRIVPGRKGLSAILVHGPSVMDAILLDGSKSIPQVADALGIKQEVAYHLARRGFLKTRRYRNRSGSRVSDRRFQEFTNKYVFPSQLGHDKGSYPGWASDQLIAAGVKPVSGPGIDGGRQFVFRRKHVDAFNWRKVPR